MRYSPITKPPPKGFTVLELIIVISLLGMVAALSIVGSAQALDASRRTKLLSNVSQMNSAVRAYLAFNGTLAGVEDPYEVLVKLKSVALPASAKTMPGLQGHFIDPRTAIVMQNDVESATDALRAYWDQDSLSFVLARKGPPGIGRFEFDDALAELPLVFEERTPLLAYASEDNWIWDFEEQATSGSKDPTLVEVPLVIAPSGPEPEVTLPSGPVTAPPPVSPLQPPLFSIPTGEYPIAQFDLPVTLANPNPSGSSKLFYRVDAGEWMNYTGSSFTVPPDALLEAMVIPEDVTGWTASDIVAETYTAIPEELRVAELAIAPAPPGADPGTVVTLANPNDAAASIVAYNVSASGWVKYEQPFTVPPSPQDTIVETQTLSYSDHYVDSDVTAHTIPGSQPVIETVIVDADADTSISGSVPNWSGDSTQLYATADSAYPSVAMVYFDVSDDIGANATVASAVVYLTSTDPYGTNGPFAVHEVQAAGAAWKNGGYTWSQAGDGLSTNGVELKSAAEDTSQVTTVIPGVAGASDRKKWDITGLVQKWVDEPSSNNGFAIVPVAPHREIFCSREHLSDKVRPKLVVTYSTTSTD